ncbi:TonB-dependent receptor [Flavisphingomonas formosensis]|uniref:TonB-dependent receptor n=1 Tax=Flavisphingomonas formosensis TaxID=861534 RepID=UPI0012F973F0|nr:TonB-dependent receptor [Sphingomonas formosensis]
MKKPSLVAIFATSICAVATPAQAQSRSYDIAAGGLKSTLDAYGWQSGRQVLYRTDDISGVRSDGVRGTLDADTALARLLRGTGFTFRVDASGAIAIVPGEGEAGSAAADSESAEIIVTGTRIPGVDVPVPAITIRRDQIRNSGYASVADIFDDLPQNSREMSADASIGTGVSDLALSNGQGTTGISLRGLGAESTLVLLNGHRRAGNVDGRVVDISAIPLAIVDRVEIVTGGRSAIYGSDAVAGVVNLVTRQDFEGMESEFYLGSAAKGGERIGISHTGGIKSERGGLVLAYDFRRERNFDIVRAGLGGPSPFDVSLRRFDARPDSKRHSLYAAGHYRIADAVEIYGDALYTSDLKRTVLDYTSPFFDFTQNSRIRSRQYSAVLGAKVDLGGGWHLDVSGNHGAVRNRENVEDSFGGRYRKTSARLTEASAVIEGALFAIGAHEVKAAFGAEYRKEELTNPTLNADRNIASAFGELIVPFDIGGGEVEFSAAGRSDRYSDFGSTFNPQAGLVWKPAAGLAIRGAYSRAFRAPPLLTLSQSNQAFLQYVPDPKTGGVTPMLIWLGGNAALRPERATTWSAGFDYSPPSASWLTVSASYFSIDYRHRIDQPIEDTGSALLDEAFFGSLVNRMPADSDARRVIESALSGDLGASGFINMTDIDFDPATQNLLDIAPGLVVFDNRRANIGSDKVDGVDTKIDLRFGSATDKFSIGADGTYYLNSKRKITPLSPAVNRLNTPGQLVDFRVRGSASWTHGAFALFGYLNYVDDYRDSFTSPERRIGSLTTIDLTARIDGDQFDNPGPLRGVSVTFNIDNLFDKKPPLFASSDFGLGYDPANASPLGRYFALQVTKRW